MTDTANETLSAAEYREKHGRGTQPTLDGMGAPADEYDQALAIDPGADTGVAWTNGDAVETRTTDFWTLIRRFGPANPASTVVILEAPYLSRQSMGRKPAIAYNSGAVAREAELLRDRIEWKGYPLIEHDPSQQGSKWDRDLAKQVVGGWEGPDNEHCRDALRLLFFYNFL